MLASSWVKWAADRLSLPGSPGRDGLFLLAAIFFFFSLIGYVSGIAWVKITSDVAWLVLSGFVSGLFAVGYATAIMYRRWWLIPVTLIFQFYIVPDPLWNALQQRGVVNVYTVILDDGTNSKTGLELAARVKWVGVYLSIGSLALGQIFLISYLRRVSNATARQRAELAVAKRLHATLVPDIDATVAGVRIVGKSVPSSEMGGDWLDVVATETGCDVFVADVSGHGVKAGVVMAMVKGAVRMRLGGEAASERASLAELVRELNALLCETIESGMFVTMACVRIEGAAAKRTVRVALAGHVPILWFQVKTGEVVRVENESLPMGIDSQTLFEERVIACEAGDTLVVSTDGLMETQNLSGRMLGIGPLEAALRANGHEAVEVVQAAVMRTAKTFGSSTDDQTLVVLRL